jgi:hypothetical protein
LPLVEEAEKEVVATMLVGRPPCTQVIAPPSVLVEAGARWCWRKSWWSRRHHCLDQIHRVIEPPLLLMLPQLAREV